MNILTFDIEDWYCHDNYSQNFNWDNHEVRIYEPLEKILAYLNNAQVKGTFFCLGWLAEKHPKVIRMISAEGHHIGSHSYQHQLAYRFNKREFYEDTYKSKALIEDIIGVPVDCYRAPSYSITPKNPYAFDVLAELGFKYDCSVFPTSRECGGYSGYGSSVPGIIRHNGYEIKEFPMNVFSLWGHDIVFSGGGYFRILPYSFIKYFAGKSEYIMSYFHPSDFDPGQPRMKHLSKMRQFKNEVCLAGAFDKFKKYINEHKVMNLIEANETIDWKQAKFFDIND